MLSSLNENAVSWSEIQVTANVVGGGSFTTTEIKAITYESKVDRGEQRGASGGRVLKRTTGQISNTASCTFYKGGKRAFEKQLAEVAPKDSAGRPQLSKVTFDIVVKHSLPDDDDIYCTKLNGCHYDKMAGNHAEGTDPDTSDTDLNPIEIVEVLNGQDTVLL